MSHLPLEKRYRSKLSAKKGQSFLNKINQFLKVSSQILCKKVTNNNNKSPTEVENYSIALGNGKLLSIMPEL